MAAKQRFLDVWIVESNTVYKEVPFNVVTDWAQQGRLLEDDKGKPSGTQEWQRLGDLADLTPYFPKAQPLRPADPAEALGPVGLDVPVRRGRHEEEDDDVDMIPLIDVSLVLLVFFMLTATAAAVTTSVNTPETEHALMADDPDALRIDIRPDEKGAPLFSLAAGGEQPTAEERDLPTVAALLDWLQARLAKQPGTVELVINADRTLKAKVARDLLVALRREPFRSKVTANYYGVSEKGENEP